MTAYSSEGHRLVGFLLQCRTDSLGIFHSRLWDWRSSQRDRLAVFGSEAKARGKGSRVLMRNKGKWDSQTMNRQDLIKQYLDVGLVPKDIGWNVSATTQSSADDVVVRQVVRLYHVREERQRISAKLPRRLLQLSRDAGRARVEAGRAV